VAVARSLAGLKVLVTGASSGIGAAVSAVLAQRRATVFGTGRDGAALEAEGGPFLGRLALDLTHPGAPEAVVSAAAEALGGLDVVVSNAGAGWAGPFEDMATDELDWILDVNLRAPLHLAHAAAPHLRRSAAGGQLVLVGSIAGLVGVPDEVAYCTAKAGLRGLAESLRAEWKDAATGGPTRALSVTLVSPGPVNTAFFVRRNRPYARSWPKPVPVEAVANKIVATIERRQSDVVVPAWLAVPARLNGGLPALYQLLYRQQR
jgi:NAD(P)-dependent dehydrogenase (short-subunit alcohol dehydrogenase family)